MPLIGSTRRRILPETPRLGAKTLPVPFLQQEQTQWCWAACAHMVLHYYGDSSVRQCDCANWLFGLSGCCPSPSSSLCNRPCAVAEVCRVYSAWSLHCTASAGSVAFASLQFELNADRPVEAAFAWHGGGGHVVIVRGWYSGIRVSVHDPWYGQGVISYADFVSAYGLGSWFWTFTGLRR